MDKLTNSLDFNAAEVVLTDAVLQIRDWQHRTQLITMLNNIRNRTRELSKLEVVARQHHKPSMTVELLNSINEDIEHLEQLITFATLLS